jgi:hypothetical protein
MLIEFAQNLRTSVGRKKSINWCRKILQRSTYFSNRMIVSVANW